MYGNSRRVRELTEIVHKCSPAQNVEILNVKSGSRYTLYPPGFEGCVVREDADPYKFSESRHFLTPAPLCTIAAGNIISSVQVFKGRKFCTYPYNVVKN
jgi:hypothetical protein